MSIQTMCHAFVQRPPSPLMKLILVAIGDHANEFTGCAKLDIDHLERFCCVSRDDLMAAIEAMFDGGWLIHDEGEYVRLGGYEAPDRSLIPPRYQKQPISLKVRRAVYARDGNTCRICGTIENLSVDHIHPERHGGTLDMDNLQTLCRPCNSRKGSRVA